MLLTDYDAFIITDKFLHKIMLELASYDFVTGFFNASEKCGEA